MQLSKPVPWKQLLTAAGTGAAVFWLLEGYFLLTRNHGIDTALFALCPASIMLMAADNTKGFAMFELLLMISIANALLYCIVIALILAILGVARKGRAN